MDELSLVIPNDKRNIYTAHEVLQVVPLLDRGRVYKKFLEENSWVGEYWMNGVVRSKKHVSRVNNASLLQIASHALRTLEPIAYCLQLLHMRHRRTKELIEPGRAFFHPIDWSQSIAAEFRKRLWGNTELTSGFKTY